MFCQFCVHRFLPERVECSRNEHFFTQLSNSNKFLFARFSFKGDPVAELNAPSSYTFEGSSDGKEWKVLFNVETGKDKGKEFKTVDEVKRMRLKRMRLKRMRLRMRKR